MCSAASLTQTSVHSFIHEVTAPARTWLDSAAPIQQRSRCRSHESMPPADILRLNKQLAHITESHEVQGKGHTDSRAALMQQCAAFPDADLAQALHQALLSPQWC